jgi:hypothetical protein
VVHVDGEIVRFFQLTLGNSPHAVNLRSFRALLGQIGKKIPVSGVDIVGLVKKENL